MLRYALSEIIFRRGRSLVTVISIALAVLAAVVLTALATSYGNALHVSEPQAATRQNRSAQGSIFAPPSRRGRPGRFTKAVMKNSRRSRVRYQAKLAQTPPSRRATSIRDAAGS